MKKLFTIVLLVFGVFTLASCTEDLPGLDLVGDQTITINKGDTFDDPGVTIIGDFDLEVETETDLDVNTAGTYTVTYKITFNGVEFTETRTVIVADEESGVPSLSLEGDQTITIYVGDAFIDPGVTIIGDFDLEIETVSNVDVDTAGTYEVTYTITYNEIEYTETRTVIVIEQVVETPELALNGSEVIYINVYGVYDELGAYVIGDPNAIVNIASNVDASTIGEYEVIYSITFEDTTISISREVNVVDFSAALAELNINYITENITETSILLNVSLDDDSSYLENFVANLYLEDTLIESININNGQNYITFDELSMGATYTIVLNGTFDNGLISFDLENYTIQATTLIDVTPEITFVSDSILPQQYTVVIMVNDPHSSLVSATATLHYIEEVFETKTLEVGENTLTFNNIYGEGSYFLEIEYAYADPSTGQNQWSGITYDTFTTPAVPTPNLTLSYEETTTSITATPSINAEGYSDITLHYYIYQDGAYLESYNTSSLTEAVTFSNLGDNTEYSIKVFASYHHNESNFDYSFISLYEGTVTTEEVSNFTVPTVTNFTVTEDLTGVDNKITFEFDFNDPDNTVQGNIFILLDYGSLKAIQVNVGHNVIVFEGYYINENVTYEYYVRADYLLNAETYLNSQKIYEGSITTSLDLPVLDFDSTDTFFVGDHTVLMIALTNETDININHFTINGSDYSTYSFPSNNQIYYIDLGVSSEANTTIYALEAINVTLVDGSDYDIAKTDTTSVTVYEVGSYVPLDAYVEVLDITTNNIAVLVPENDTSSTTVYIHLDNEYNLPIESFKINNVLYTSNDFTITNNVIAVSYDVSQGFNSLYLSDLTYTKNSESIVLVQEEMRKDYLFGYYSEDVVSITTVTDFLNMNTSSGKYYRLDADLDFTGILVNPLGDYDNPFTGCFDGNGHVLSNITINNNALTNNQTQYVGLFGYSHAFFIDITIDNIDITVVNDPSVNSFLYVGTLAGVSNAYTNNVHVIGDSSITVNGVSSGNIGGLFGANQYASTIIKNSSANTTIVVNGEDFDNASYFNSVGGLIGISTNTDIRASHSSGSITITNTDDVTYLVGGLAGSFYGDSNYAYILNSYSTVDISSENTYYGEVGGLVGRSTNITTTAMIINSYASGDVFSSNGKVGGLIGGSAITLNSMSFGNISSTASNAGATIGNGSYVSEGSRIDKYVYEDQTFTRNGVDLSSPSDFYTFNLIPASESLLNTQYFYEYFLNWNSYFYDFSNLDVSQGDLPVHN